MERKKIHLEYLLNATSKSILWAAISTPTGLEGWFADRVQSSKYNLGFLPTVVANEGYTFKGWKVTNKAGEEIYNLDANAT